MMKTKVIPVDNQSENNQTEISRLSKSELDKLCIEFLIEIDPSLKWLKIYNKLKLDNNIIYDRLNESEIPEWSCIDSNEDIKVYAPLSGTISDFPNFINVFASYVSLTSDTEKTYPSDIKTFPSIFFEMYAQLFLKEEGYLETVPKTTSTPENYLATKALEKVTEDQFFMYTILEITENLSQETIESINKKIGLSTDELATQTTKAHQYKK